MEEFIRMQKVKELYQPKNLFVLIFLIKMYVSLVIKDA